MITNSCSSQISKSKHQYDINGYVVFRRLIPSEKIDTLLDVYKNRILSSNTKFYRQNTNTYDTNRLTEGGHVIQSFLDIHNYKRFPDFRRRALEMYFSDQILSALTELTESTKHNLMQTMLFDANAETPPHQDWWYLDTVPNGGLIGAWIALEDIHEDAGRFYVMPGTQEVALHEKDLPHSTWLARMKEYVKKHSANISVPTLNKGDVLFWNSRTIHGSLPTKNILYSRKSLTGHYMPSRSTFGNLFITKPWVHYEDFEGNQYFANQPEYSVKAELVSKVKVALYDNPRLLKIARKFQNRSISEA